MDLSRIAVHPIDEDCVSGLCFDDARVLDLSPWKLGECFPGDGLALLAGTEAVLLRVGSVPDPVHEKVRCEQDGQDRGAEGIIGDAI